MGPFRYRVEGTISDQDSGQPLGGLVIRAYDLDLLKDDLLGVAVTDKDGHFEIHFTELAFVEIPGERPDIYLRVFDASWRHELAGTRHEVRRNARADERFTLRIRRPPRSDAASA